VARRTQQVADVLKPAQLGQARPAVTVLGLADEHDRPARGPRPTSPRKSQNVNFVPGFVLTAGAGALADRAHRQARLVIGVARDPFGGERFEVRAVNL